ncbi:cytochrome b/b6 domain-containing protein [Arthrobacter sp. CG_A4]|uniref:cytochrome b/b6 domain-containing protein n=1 Tax=Arthrobacter sp. CG_A4 TaxID=3071706 RepID=UPI002E0DCA44
MAPLSRSIRRGLPRVEGGEPWPAAGQAPAHIVTAAAAPSESVSGVGSVIAAPADAAAVPAAALETAPGATAVSAPVPAVKSGAAVARQLRRGLPRVPGGEPWPPSGLVPAPAADSAPAPAVQAAPEHIALAPTPAPAPTPTQVPTPFVVGPVAEAERTSTASTPAVTVAPAAAAPAVAVEQPVKPEAEARLYGSRTLGQWIKRVVLLAVGAVAAAAILVLAARGVTTLPGVPAFLERYPGEYHLPQTAEPGFPWWAQWTHFLNFFLIVLIIRSGYQVRTQQKPPAFWTPKRGGKKISITLWLHQSLDILWLVNGLVFVVLLFASGHWMRIVPTSWEVFPNALSALLQYMTLDWPVENGWVNYNSLQQLMYFLVVFIAAPLAAITGVRMSEFWPTNAKTLDRIYPVEAARAVHFPTMLFFVLFILVHVFLVLSTGALRNLNHMFGGTDVVNWTGFWLFAAAIAITIAGWYAARPILLAPLAKLFGQVSSR